MSIAMERHQSTCIPIQFATRDDVVHEPCFVASTCVDGSARRCFTRDMQERDVQHRADRRTRRRDSRLHPYVHRRRRFDVFHFGAWKVSTNRDVFLSHRVSSRRSEGTPTTRASACVWFDGTHVFRPWFVSERVPFAHLFVPLIMRRIRSICDASLAKVRGGLSLLPRVREPCRSHPFATTTSVQHDGDRPHLLPRVAS